ncbi:MAG: DUF4352 domain-containing protein [Patescibacteria group bacterium]|nr:DUF4352 domain-containing protein [Patescibacteria group bacterium]
MKKALGLGCGSIAGLFVLLVVVAIVGSRSGSTAPNASASAAATSVPLKVGEKLTAGNWEYTITKASKPGNVLKVDEFTTLKALGTWVQVDMTLTNVAKQNFDIGTNDFTLVDAGGTKYDVTDQLGYYTWLDKAGLATLRGQKPPNIPFKSALLFDVNPAAKGLHLELVQAKRSVDLGL